MALDTDLDDQDQAEAYDEEATGGDADGESTYPLDRATLDETTARGDADLEGDDDALDADEEDDESLGELDDAGEEDDLDDEGADVDALSGDDIPDYTPDADFPENDETDGVAAHADDEAEVIAMGDMMQTGGGGSVADFESDELSDADLEELDYKDAGAGGKDDDRVRTKGGEAVDGDRAAGDAATDDDPAPGEATVRHDDKRLDEGLEETFPASDPVSAKHIT